MNSTYFALAILLGLIISVHATTVTVPYEKMGVSAGQCVNIASVYGRINGIVYIQYTISLGWFVFNANLDFKLGGLTIGDQRGKGTHSMQFTLSSYVDTIKICNTNIFNGFDVEGYIQYTVEAPPPNPTPVPSPAPLPAPAPEASTPNPEDPPAKSWAGTWKMKDTCNQNSCCCLTGKLEIRASQNALALSGSFKGLCDGLTKYVATVPDVPVGDVVTIQVLGSSFRIVRSGKDMVAENLDAPDCSGQATCIAGNCNSASTMKVSATTVIALVILYITML